MEINRDNIEKRLRDEFEPTYLVSPTPSLSLTVERLPMLRTSRIAQAVAA